MIPGWLHEGEGEALKTYAAKCPGPWVEIGSYCGLSASYLAAALPADGLLFCVDPHKGNPEMQPGMSCHHEDVWAHENGSLSVLLETIDAHRDRVVPVVGTGDQFARTGVRPGFVFIDAFHEYEGVRNDFDVWGNLLADGGLLALHDSDVPHWGPGLVVTEALKEGWALVDRVQSLAVLSS